MKKVFLYIGVLLSSASAVVSIKAASITVSDTTNPTGGPCVGDKVSLTITGEQDTPPSCKCGGSPTYVSTEYTWTGDFQVAVESVSNLDTSAAGTKSVSCKLDETFKCDDGSTVSGTENASMPATTVYANNTAQCTPSAPNGGSKGTPDIPLTNYQLSSTPSLVPFGWFTSEVSGTVTNVISTESYRADGALSSTDCGRAYTDSKAAPSGNVGVSFGVISLSYNVGSGPSGSANVPATPNKRIYHQLYDYIVTPTSGSMTGGHEETDFTSPVDGTSFVSSNNNWSGTFSLGGGGVDGYVFQTCLQDCCPTN
jgi:hypothetical protein